MGRFADYQTNRKMTELAAYCDANGISLQPLVDECYRLMEHTDLTDREIYNELMGAVGKFAGNLATGAANFLGQGVGAIKRGAGAMANSFAQGYQQRANPQQPPANGQAPAANGQVQQPPANGQAPAANGQAQQPPANGQAPQNNAGGGQATQQLQTVQKMLQKLGADQQQITGLVDQLTKSLSQQTPAAPVKPS